MQIPILNGIYSSTDSPALRVSYPINWVPVPKQSGINKGYLRPADGIVQFAVGQGADRGGINWNNVCYRVSGTKLISLTESGTVNVLGDVGGTGYVKFDYSFDCLAIASGGSLYYWDGATLTQVTDPDLGNVVDMVWVDGYFMTTDGEFVIVTELTDRTQVNPLKYGSSEVDPDRIVGLKKPRKEVFVINRHSIEVLDNTGGDFFPFSRIEGAYIAKGAIGTNACCNFLDSVAFLGGGRNEQISVYLASNASAQKIASQDIDTILSKYSESELENAKLETKIGESHQFLYIHLPDKTLVFDAWATEELGEPIWFILVSSVTDSGEYRARNIVRCYNKWIVGDTQSSNIGVLSESTANHWGSIVKWEFDTPIVYNEGKGALFHSLEIIALNWNIELGKNPNIYTTYSLDGMSWSQPKTIGVGSYGNSNKRLRWLQQGFMRNWRVQKFVGDSQSPISIVRLEAELEPLAY